MKTTRRTLLLAFLLLLGSALGYAQKFGYLNSAALLAEVPEVKQADANLKAFQTQLMKKGQEMANELQEKAAALERKKEQGTISPRDYQAQLAKLQEEEEALSKYEQEVYAKLSRKREEEYRPILERVNKIVEEVSREHGFMLVFDSSTRAVVYAEEALDLTPLVKAKLGLK
ncbi:MAG: OmpH family outer membrane protein [Saprospiraceae bacterium]|nr:OmpH family outer membrane protein [Saprospiraceae bacterium]MDW8484832.1 OmpH family outer membrane protein [Saprospiraceae bacterium]